MKKNVARRLLWGAGLTLIVSISGATLVANFRQDAKADAAVPVQATPVSVAVVEPRETMTWEEFSGRLEAVDRVDLRSRVAGAIQAVHFREGALVEQGELLITIDPAPYAAAVAQAEAVVAAAKARLELTGLELERGQKLAENRTVSQSNLDQRLSAHHEAQASLGSAEAALQSAKLNLDYTEIRAPISGRVGKIEITEGNLVAASAGSPVLTSLVSVDPIYASFSVGEQFATRALAELPAGAAGAPSVEQIPVEISTAGGDGAPIRGQLQFIDNEVDAASGTIRVRAVFGNSQGRLLPGQFVRVRLGQPKPAPELVISERAVGTDQDKRFVFVVDAENKIAYRQVMLGATAEGLRIVEEGLDAGERIVVNGLQRVRPGALVDPQPVAMAPVEQALAGAEMAQR